MLNFEKFKNRGLVCLDKENTEKLLEISEDAKASLAVMLTSRHVAPLRDEAAGWAVKLKEVGEVLEQVNFVILKNLIFLCCIVQHVLILLHDVSPCDNVLHRIAKCCAVLQCVAPYFIVLHRIAL